jgi:hypothetical protein
MGLMASECKNVDLFKRDWIRRIKNKCVGWRVPHDCRGRQCCHLKDGVHKDDNQMFPACVKFHTDWHHMGPAWCETHYGLPIMEALCDEIHQQWLESPTYKAVHSSFWSPFTGESQEPSRDCTTQREGSGQ